MCQNLIGTPLCPIAWPVNVPLCDPQQSSSLEGHTLGYVPENAFTAWCANQWLVTTRTCPLTKGLCLPSSKMILCTSSSRDTSGLGNLAFMVISSQAPSYYCQMFLFNESGSWNIVHSGSSMSRKCSSFECINSFLQMFLRIYLLNWWQVLLDYIILS